MGVRGELDAPEDLVEGFEALGVATLATGEVAEVAGREGRMPVMELSGQEYIVGF